MTIQDVQLSGKHQQVLDRFLLACQVDDRISAAFLIGSNAKGRADEHSDLDLFLAVTDEDYEDFVAARDAFVRRLGEPAFAEDFGNPNILFLIFPDGSEVEINYARASDVARIFDSQYKVLIDKKNMAAHITLRQREFHQSSQREKLRRLIHWFWHNFSHFVTAMARNQLWWGQGQLEIMRAECVGLARLRNDFSDPEVEEEVYFKIENALPVEQLSPLQNTYVPTEREAMLEAAFVIVDFYRKLATALAQEHGISYPEALEKVMVERLKKLRNR